MNARRGLFRVWLAFTALWAGLVFLARVPGVLQHGGATFWHRLSGMLVFAFAIPCTLLAAGMVLVWIVSGFRSPRANA